MDDKIRNEIALMRYTIIAPLISDTLPQDLSKTEFFQSASTKSYLDPAGKPVRFSDGTIERWYYNYKKDGFDALIPKGRSDAGQPRKMDQDVMEQIQYYKQEYPRIPATLIYEKLLNNGVITKKDLSLSSVNRYINRLNYEQKYTRNKDMRRYERQYINEVWCGDSSVGPYLKIDGKKKRTYIIALLDDASRMITGIDIFMNDNFVNLMSVMRNAIMTYGKPKVFNFDNGSPYKNKQMSLLGARLGVSLNYCAPYTPTSKSKIERWFRSMKDHWMATLNMKDFNSLEELRKSLYAYVDQYHHTMHSSLNGCSPSERFFQDSGHIIRLPAEQLDTFFLLEIERRVSADNVIVIDQEEYEVHYRYARQRITLRYSADMKHVYIVGQNGKLEEIKLLNKHENAHIKREKIKYTGGEE